MLKQVQHDGQYVQDDKMDLLRTTQNPLSWILLHEKQLLISQPLSFALFFATSDWVRYRSHGVLLKIRSLG